MKRLGVLLLSSVVVLVVAAAGVALAANVDCSQQSKNTQGGHCIGTNGKDVITGTQFNDIIAAGGRADTVNARAGNDEVYGDHGADTLDLGGGGDYGEGGRGEDILRGGPQNDALNVVDGQGGDVANGGDGDDDCFLDNRDANDESDVGANTAANPGFPSDLGNDVATNCENIYVLDKVADTTP